MKELEKGPKRPTDRPTDTARDRGALAHLKIRSLKKRSRERETVARYEIIVIIIVTREKRKIEEGKRNAENFVSKSG